MTLFWHPTGLLIRYDRDAFDEILTIEDLNPEVKLRYRMTPMELLKFGFKCIWAAICP